MYSSNVRKAQQAHNEDCTLRKRMYASSVRNCSQKDTAVARAAPK